MNTNHTPAAQPNKVLWFSVCIIILGAGIAGFMLLQALKPEPEQRPETVLIPAIQTAPLTYRQSPLLIEGNGIVSPRAEIAISSQVTGEVLSIHPNLVTGGSFAAGDVIIQIDPRSFEAKLAEAEADKAVTVSSLNFINKQIERLKSLREQGYSPEEDLDDAIARREQSLANITRLEAIIKSRRLDLERTTIKAAFTGKVLSKSVDVGDIVSSGKELARFYNSSEIEIVISLNTKEAAFIPGLWSSDSSKHNKAWISVNHGGQTYEWPGYLDRVEADIDSATRTTDVVVRIPEPSQPGKLLQVEGSPRAVTEAPPLLIGMYGTARIEGMILDKHFVIPTSAVHNHAIWILDEESRLKVIPVELIKEEGDMAVLLAPQLSPGTDIIVSSIALVSDGMQVQKLSEEGK